MSVDEQNKVYNTKGLAPNLSMPVKGAADSTTKSAVAPATIDIRENPTQDISALSRDTANSLNELGRIFDKKTIEEQQELAAVFGEEAFRLLHNMKDDGSGRKIAAHAIIGGLMSQITGAGFASGAIGAGLNEALIKALDGKDPGTGQMISAVIGAAAAKAIGGNAQAGASAAASGTKWNKYERLPEIQEQLKHLPESEIYQGLKDGEYIFLNGVDENKYVVSIAVNNKGEAWDIFGGDHGTKVEISAPNYFSPTVYNDNLVTLPGERIPEQGKYIGKLIPPANNQSKVAFGKIVGIETFKAEADRPVTLYNKYANNPVKALKFGVFAPLGLGYDIYQDYGKYSGTDLAKVTLVNGGAFALTFGADAWLIGSAGMSVEATILANIIIVEGANEIKKSWAKTDEEKRRENP